MMQQILAVLAAFATVDAFEIQAMKHDIQLITGPKFDSIIGKFRDSAVSALWFFKDDNKDDEKFLEDYNKVAGDLKGMAKICAINCNDWKPFCDKQGVKATPKMVIYPTNPQPAFDYTGKMEVKPLSSAVARLIPDFSVKLADGAAVDTFLTTEPTKPKVILFSNKKTPALMFKALSSETVFKRTVKFGFVQESQAEICKRFNIKKFPSLIMLSGTKVDKQEKYDGEMNFLGLKEWVNLRSESGMGDKLSGTGGKTEESIEEAKPWLVQEVPELTQKSHKDICFKGEGLCVIYLKEGPTTQDEVDMLTGLSKKFTSQLSDRGAKMKWMWMDLQQEEGFKNLFNPSQLPSAVVFNPHKRLRFTMMDHGEDNDVKGDATALSNLMDKVLGGDARFKVVPGQKLPAWSQRDAKKKTEL